MYLIENRHDDDGYLQHQILQYVLDEDNFLDLMLVCKEWKHVILNFEDLLSNKLIITIIKNRTIPWYDSHDADDEEAQNLHKYGEDYLFENLIKIIINVFQSLSCKSSTLCRTCNGTKLLSAATINDNEDEYEFCCWPRLKSSIACNMQLHDLFWYVYKYHSGYPLHFVYESTIKLINNLAHKTATNLCEDVLMKLLEYDNDNNDNNDKSTIFMADLKNTLMIIINQYYGTMERMSILLKNGRGVGDDKIHVKSHCQDKYKEEYFDRINNSDVGNETSPIEQDQRQQQSSLSISLSVPQGEEGEGERQHKKYKCKCLTLEQHFTILLRIHLHRQIMPLLLSNFTTNNECGRSNIDDCITQINSLRLSPTLSSSKSPPLPPGDIATATIGMLVENTLSKLLLTVFDSYSCSCSRSSSSSSCNEMTKLESYVASLSLGYNTCNQDNRRKEETKVIGYIQRLINLNKDELLIHERQEQKRKKQLKKQIKQRKKRQERHRYYTRIEKLYGYKERLYQEMDDDNEEWMREHANEMMPTPTPTPTFCRCRIW